MVVQGSFIVVPFWVAHFILKVTLNFIFKGRGIDCGEKVKDFNPPSNVGR